MAAYKDKESYLSFSSGLDVQDISGDTTTNGNWIDTKGFGSLTFDFFITGYTSGTFTPLLEDAEADDQADAAEVTDQYLIPAGTDAADQEADQALTAAGSSKIGYTGSKRYVRLSLVSTDTGSATGVGGRAVLSAPDYARTA